MKELEIKIGNTKMGREITLELYEKFLQKDTSFHIFWEGEYLQLRCDRKYIKPIQQYLESIGVMVHETSGDYHDPNPDVAKYEKYYIPIFHQYTLLGIELLKSGANLEEIKRHFDRIYHLFYICNVYSLVKDNMTEDEEIDIEPQILSSLTLGRAKYCGMRRYYLMCTKTKGKEEK